MKKIIGIFTLSSTIAFSAQAVKFEFDKTTLEIKGKSYIASTNIKDSNGNKVNRFNDGGEKTEIEFKFKHHADDNNTIFGEVEIASNVFSDNNGKGDLSTDDIVLGVENKQFGQFSFSKNNDDPVEKYVAEGLDLTQFSNVTEASTTSSKNNQFQYKSPNLNSFNIVLGAAKPSDNDTKFSSSIDTSYVLNYNNTVLGNKLDLSIGSGEIGDDNVKGITAQYQVGDTKFIVLAIDDEKDNEKLQGFGISHKLNKKSELNLAYQKVDKTGSDKRSEVALSYQYKIFKYLKLFAETAKFDKANDEDDIVVLGAKFSF